MGTHVYAQPWPPWWLMPKIMIQPASQLPGGKAVGEGNFMDLSNGPCKCIENIRKQTEKKEQSCS